jgi:hypothetical protein
MPGKQNFVRVFLNNKIEGPLLSHLEEQNGASSRNINICPMIRDAPDIRQDNPAFFYIRYPAG